MHNGLVLTVEPFLSRGGRWATSGVDDEWTLYSELAALVVQYDTVVATRRGAVVVTLPG